MLCNEGKISAQKDGDKLIVTYKDGDALYKSSFEKNEDGEWEPSLFADNDVETILDIVGDYDMLSFMFSCLKV